MTGKVYNIAHLMASNFFGGPEKQLVEHVRRITGERFAASIISFVEKNNENQLLERARGEGLAALGLASSGALDVRPVRDLVRVLDKGRTDIVCVHGYKACVIGSLAARMRGTPLVSVSRGWTGESLKVRIYEGLDKLFQRFADHVVAVSQGQRDILVSCGVRPGKITVIRNAVDPGEHAVMKPSAIRSELGIPETAVFVASAGRLSPEKNYAGMIDAARLVVSMRDDVYFAVFGEGDLRAELEARIGKAGMKGRFLLPGFRTDMRAIMAEVDIFMLTSFSEGLPNVILEAFAAGKPVVATRVGGIPEVVENGISGYLARPGEIRAMAAFVGRLAGNPVHGKIMGAKGYERVCADFSFERQTAQYERLYQMLAGRGKSGGQGKKSDGCG